MCNTMAELSVFVDMYPRIKRNIAARAAWIGTSEENRAIAKKYGKEYFDGTRDQGYGGFYYDGRWKPIVKKMAEVYDLTNESTVLDIGCAKGFMLHDLKALLPGITVAGIDISEYGIEHAMEDIKPYLKIGNCVELPYPSKKFDASFAVNIFHNLPLEYCKKAIQEMIRVTKKHMYIQVDSFRNVQEKDNLDKWQLTAELIYNTDQWKVLFSELGYQGDYYWTITE